MACASASIASFIEHLPSGLSPHEWQAQAVMTVRFAQRQLAAHPLELAVVRAEFARGRDFVLGLAALRDWLKPGPTRSSSGQPWPC